MYEEPSLKMLDYSAHNFTYYIILYYIIGLFSVRPQEEKYRLI